MLNNPTYSYPRYQPRRNAKGSFTKHYTILLGTEPYGFQEDEVKCFQESDYNKAVNLYNSLFDEYALNHRLSFIEEVREDGLCRHDMFRTIKSHIPDDDRTRNYTH